MRPELLQFFQAGLKNYQRPIHRVLILGPAPIRGPLRQLFDRGTIIEAIAEGAWAGAQWVGPPWEYAHQGWDGGLFDALLSAEWLAGNEWDRTIKSCTQLIRPGGKILIAADSNQLIGGPALIDALAAAGARGDGKTGKAPDLRFNGFRSSARDCLRSTNYPFFDDMEQHSTSHDADPNGIVRIIRVQPPHHPVIVGRGPNMLAACEQALVGLGLKKLLG